MACAWWECNHRNDDGTFCNTTANYRGKTSPPECPKCDQTMTLEWDERDDHDREDER